MSISQMMIAGSSGGRPPKSASWNSIAYVPLYEGQQQTVTVDFANWDNSTVYWSLVQAGSSASLDSRVVGGQASGYINPGNGNSTQTINFTFSSDATTEGPINYVVRVGSTPGSNDYLDEGNYALVDSSQTPALVLDLDTVRYTETVNTVENNGTELHIPKAFDSSLDTKISIGYPVTTSWGGGLHTTVTGISSGTGSFGPEWIVTVATNVSAGFAGGDSVTFASDSIWPDSSGQNHNAGIYFLDAYSTDNGGVYLWNGSSTQAEVTGLNGSTYGTITLSAWIKPSTVTGSNQTIIAKELCYKLRINGDGTTTMSTGKGNSGWEVTATADAGVVTAGAWSQLVATVDANYTRIYVNGVKVTETSGNIIGANSYPFDIGMYQTTGSPSDFFGGRMGEVKVWNYALTEANVADQYNTHCTRYGLNPIPQSLAFNPSSHQYIGVDGTSDWALGTNWTIEYWSKHTTATTQGGPSLYTVMSQAPAGGGIDIFYQDGSLKFNNGTVLVNEPLAGHWTHVALVCDSGNINVYYNGRQQTLASPVSANLGNGSDPLYIGRRGNNDFQHFPGELTGIRINNTALYNTTFTPDRLPAAPTGTKLLLNGYYPLVDQSTSGHGVSNGGSTLTNDFPKLTATGGTGSAGTGHVNVLGGGGITVTLTPSTDGTGTPGTAYPGDTITWTITSDPSFNNIRLYYWVDYDRAPASTWVENSNNGSVILDGAGNASFTRTVAQSAGVLFRVYIGTALYQGTVTHGYIGV